MARGKWQRAHGRWHDDERQMTDGDGQMTDDESGEGQEAEAEDEEPGTNGECQNDEDSIEPVAEAAKTLEKVTNEATKELTQVSEAHASAPEKCDPPVRERTQDAAVEEAPGKAVGEPVVTADASGPEGHVDENPPGQETMAGNAGPDETVTPSTAKNLGPPPVATPAGRPRSPLIALAAAIAAARMGPKMSTVRPGDGPGWPQDGATRAACGGSSR